jgi:hypothetical protein
MAGNIVQTNKTVMLIFLGCWAERRLITKSCNKINTPPNFAVKTKFHWFDCDGEMNFLILHLWKHVFVHSYAKYIFATIVEIVEASALGISAGLI